MKKIPTLFERVFEGHKIKTITDKVTPGMEWVLEGKGEATIKIDGCCCAIINGELYKRYDAKKGKTPPAGAIPCCDPDPVTGHWPHWLKVDANNPADKWFLAALEAAQTGHRRDEDGDDLPGGTYEAIGPHFQGNPYNLTYDKLVPHGWEVVEVERTFEGIKKYLEEHEIEGLVSDFGLEWPVYGGK